MAYTLMGYATSYVWKGDSNLNFTPGMFYKNLTTTRLFLSRINLHVMSPNFTESKDSSSVSRLRIASIVCLFVGIVATYLIFFLFGRDQLWEGIISAAIINLSLLIVVRRIYWRINKIRALQMRSVACSDDRPPFLILRSFGRASLTFRPGRYSDNFIAPGESYLNDIAASLQDIGLTLAIGAPDDTIGMSEEHVLYFQSSEDSWLEMFSLASEAARAVIVIPGDTPVSVTGVKVPKMPD